MNIKGIAKNNPDFVKQNEVVLKSEDELLNTGKLELAMMHKQVSLIIKTKKELLKSLSSSSGVDALKKEISDDQEYLRSLSSALLSSIDVDDAIKTSIYMGDNDVTSTTSVAPDAPIESSVTRKERTTVYELNRDGHSLFAIAICLRTVGLSGVVFIGSTSSSSLDDIEFDKLHVYLSEFNLFDSVIRIDVKSLNSYLANDAETADELISAGIIYPTFVEKLVDKATAQQLSLFNADEEDIVVDLG